MTMETAYSLTDQYFQKKELQKSIWNTTRFPLMRNFLFHIVCQMGTKILIK
jgi:hypothetical protein